MRAVAFGAFTGTHRGVPYSASQNLLAQITMTGETYCSLLIHDHSRKIAPVGIMAGETLPSCKRHMVRTAGNFFHEVTVTVCAERRDRRFQKFPLCGRMRVMAQITSG